MSNEGSRAEFAGFENMWIPGTFFDTDRKSKISIHIPGYVEVNSEGIGFCRCLFTNPKANGLIQRVRNKIIQTDVKFHVYGVYGSDSVN